MLKTSVGGGIENRTRRWARRAAFVAFAILATQTACQGVKGKDAAEGADDITDATDFSGHPAAPEIQQLITEKVVKAGAPFRPDQQITRAEFATLLARATGPLLPRIEACHACTFSDVPASHPDFLGIATATTRGFVGSVGGNRFAPSELVSREQAAAVLAKAYAFPRARPNALERFPDRGAVSSKEAAENLARAAGAGMLGNEALLQRAKSSANTLRAKEAATRAEIASFIVRSRGTIALPQPRTSALGQTERDPIDPNFLKSELTKLAGLGERFTEEGRAAARSHLADAYRALKYNVSISPFDKGQNLVAERPGDAGIVLVTGHLDSVEGVAGADDDASGLVSGLAIARALAAAPLKHTLRFVAFDQEEAGEFGSQAYANGLSESERQSVIGVINLEMTAFDSNKDGAFHVIDCERSESQPIGAAFRQAVSDRGLPLQFARGCTDRSDHASFWAINVPAVVVSENFFGNDANDCYHLPCDTVQKLDFDYMANITTASLDVVEQLARR